MRTGLISIATDTLPLDGALYLPEAEPFGAVMLFHGNTMNFYVGAPRFLPPVLTRLGFACLAFNRRGHDILSIRDSRAAEGAAFGRFPYEVECGSSAQVEQNRTSDGPAASLFRKPPAQPDEGARHW
jgi:hypothetical protein